MIENDSELSDKKHLFRNVTFTVNLVVIIKYKKNIAQIDVFFKFDWLYKIRRKDNVKNNITDF